MSGGALYYYWLGAWWWGGIFSNGAQGIKANTPTIVSICSCTLSHLPGPSFYFLALVSNITNHYAQSMHLTDTFLI